MPSLTSYSRRTTLGGLVAAFAATAIAPARAATGSADGAKRKINLAGRQRMLTQRMTMSSLMVALGVEPDRFLATAVQSYELFGTSLIGLRHGSEDLRLPVETNKSVLTKITLVETQWDAFAPIMERIIEQGGLKTTDVAAIAQMNLPLLGKSNDVVTSLVQAYGDSSIPIGLAISINIAGRQRMLSQKMAKEVALVALDHQPEETRAALGKTAGLFDASLTALTDGLPSVTLPRPPEHIREKLGEVRAIWEEYRRTVEPVAAGGDVDAADLAAIAELVDPMLVTMNEAVLLYEAL